MQKIVRWLVICAFSMFLGACGTTKDIEKERLVIENKINNLAIKETEDIYGFTNKEKSLRNSNLLNFGYLTYDEKDNIYFVDKKQGGIYICEFDGSNKRLVSTEDGFCLQVEGSWLYYRSSEGVIKRCGIEDGIEEMVYELPCGEFVIDDEKLYINTEEGICVAELDGSNRVFIQGDIELTGFSISDGFIVSNAINGMDGEWFWEGHLIGFEENAGTFFHINQRGVYPLFAGNMLSVFDTNSVTRHVWNLETQEDIDLNIKVQRVVSDGNAIYYFENDSANYNLFQWTEKETKKILSVEVHHIEYTYLTEKAIYWVAAIEENETIINGLWYYELETGAKGQIY